MLRPKYGIVIISRIEGEPTLQQRWNQSEIDAKVLPDACLVDEAFAFAPGDVINQSNPNWREMPLKYLGLTQDAYGLVFVVVSKVAHAPIPFFRFAKEAQI